MGKFVTPHKYFYLPKTVKQYMDTEKKMYDQWFNKLEDELDKLKRGMNNASEAESCQMGINEDFDDGPEDELEDEPEDEPLDTSCYLAVDIASNIVAKGTIMMYNCETTTVMLEICLQAEALLPCPLEDEFILQVKDGVGHIINWPRHLENVVVKPKRISGNLLASKIEKKPKTEPVEEDGKEKVDGK